MEPRPARPAVPPSAGPSFARVHDVVGPLTDDPAVPLGLYVHGAARGESGATRTGVRDALVIAPAERADFGSYFNAFPAAQWRAYTGAGEVRLRVVVDGGALLRVHRSDRDGGVAVVEERLLEAGVPETVAVSTGGAHEPALLWFDLQAGQQPVRLLDAGWEVAVAPRAGRVLIGGPTVHRAADVALNARRIAAAPALVALMAEYLVVDHTADSVEPRLRADLDPAADALVRVVRQPNLGGSGGYSRVMHEAVRQGAGFALLLDDDVLVEPAALLKAVEFGRRASGAEIVGLQMLDAVQPAILDAGPERIVGRTFWWAPAEQSPSGLDVAEAPVAGVPRLHRLPEAEFAGWWGALVPLEVVRTIGYAMPLFLKWDDAEYALRARRAGFGTVSLQGAAVWHESWRIKDDARTWPAFFHARNRLVAALLHGDPGVRTGVLLSAFAVEVKQLLALQTFAVQRRQEGLRAVLAGPGPLGGAPTGQVHRLLSLSAGAKDQQRVPMAQVDGEVAPAGPRALAPAAAPRGVLLAVWTLLVLIRHGFAPVRGEATQRLPAGRGTWWVLPSFDDVFTPTADGAAYFHVRRDRRLFRRLLVSSARLHLRLWLRWPTLRRAYGRAAEQLASPESWERRFAATTPLE